MIGILSVSNNEIPQVITNLGIFNLSHCKLLKHTDGSWNLNMSLNGKYTTYKEGDEVFGILFKDKTFLAQSLLL